MKNFLDFLEFSFYPLKPTAKAVEMFRKYKWSLNR